MIFWSKVVVPALNLFGLLGSVAGIVVGIALVVNSSGTLAAFAGLNRWVSTRKAMKPLEIPREAGRGASERSLRWLAVILALGGAYSAFALLALLDTAKAVAAFGVKKNLLLAMVLAESARWVLIVGGCFAVVVGVLMLFFPAAWRSLEARANTWYSTRRAVAAADGMRMTLDGWVARNPRRSGLIIGAGSVLGALAYGFLLLS